MSITDKKPFKKEAGSASINITLNNGVIKIIHGTAKIELAQWVSNGKDFDNMWSMFNNMIKKAGGYRYLDKPVIYSVKTPN